MSLSPHLSYLWARACQVLSHSMLICSHSHLKCPLHHQVTRPISRPELRPSGSQLSYVRSQTQPKSFSLSFNHTLTQRRAAEAKLYPPWGPGGAGTLIQHTVRERSLCARQRHRHRTLLFPVPPRSYCQDSAGKLEGQGAGHPFCRL